jgi:hypothetical protein
VTVPSTLDREQVVEILATYGERDAGTVPERIGSLEVAWLVHQVEQRYGVALDLNDDELVRMSTVSNAVDVLRQALGSGGA